MTSKRTSQFLEWCARERQTTWVFVSEAPLPKDQGPWVSHRVGSTIENVFRHISSIGDSSARVSSVMTAQHEYTALLTTLDDVASRTVDVMLASMSYQLTEPAIARVISEALPPGEGLFIGNSMPIRDFDMYGKTQPSSGSSDTHTYSDGSGNGSNKEMRGVPTTPQGVVHAGVGVPIAANRGASGIDGVLSTAAGFADGLERGTTLVVGDISFLHDINGLNLLRSGDMRPPLTVVLVNNGGGGIFSFLPVADHVPEEVFTPLWATPQNVDLAGMCRAHGIPHMRVSTPEELRRALTSAWALNRHSVIEAITDRVGNVERHREVQGAVKRALEEEVFFRWPGRRR